MRKLLLFLLCLGLIGCATTPGADKPVVAAAVEKRTPEPELKISEMGYRKVVILGEGMDVKLAFQYGNSYRAAVWYKEDINKGIPEPSPARKELIGELQGINAAGGEWEFVIPEIGQSYFLTTLTYMDKASMSNARGTVYLPDSSENKPIEDEILRVSENSFTIIYGQ